MKFNINCTVRVKLTMVGWNALEYNHRELYGDRADIVPQREIRCDGEGWSEWQLWDLMREFGPFITFGAAVPFETEIEIVEPT